ncbi:MAG TPA: hypothetical protein ENJ64_01400, partial [Thiotrichales bacterium]|nr:hypothetical protein [Thiotrichales bacterium]
MKTVFTPKAAMLAGMLISLAACSSSQAPWSRPDDSPWSEKHAAAKQAAPADEIVYEPASIEPEPVQTVVVAEPEPMPVAEPEPVPAEDASSRFAEPMAVEAETIAVAEPQSGEAKVMAMPAGSYAVQVYAGTTPESIERFQKKKGLEDLTVVKTDRGGKIYYVLVS